MTNNPLKYCAYILGLITFITVGSSKIFSQAKGLEKELTKQEKVDVQRGAKAGVLKKETSDSFVYGFGFGPETEKYIKQSKKPSIYTTDKGSFVEFNEDTTGFYLKIPKENFNEEGEGKPLGIAIKETGPGTSVCDENGMGSKQNPILQFYLRPINLSLERKKENQKELPTDASVTNNYFFYVNFESSGKKDNGSGNEGQGQGNETTKKKNLNLILNEGTTFGPAHANVVSPQVLYNVVNKNGFEFGPFVKYNLTTERTDITDEVRFREKVLMGSNTYKERTDVYQTETSTNDLFGFGVRGTKNFGNNFYAFLEGGFNVLKDKIKTFGTAYITYTRDSKLLEPTNKEPISGSIEDNNYKMPFEISAGAGTHLTKDFSLEGKVSHEFGKGGRTAAFLGLNFRL